MSDLKTQMSELRAIVADHDAALRGTAENPNGLASIVRETVILLHGDANTNRVGVVKRVDDMETRERERKAWLAGAIAVSGTVGSILGLLLQHFLK